MNIKYGKSKRIMASEDYATLRGMDFRKARDILTKDGFHEHEYGDKDDNNGYAVYRKGDKEVELQYRWNAGKRKGEAHAGKVTNVYVDDDINSACGKKSIKSNTIMGSDTGNSVSLYYNGRWQCSGFENAIADRLAIIMARDDKAIESIVEYCNSFGDPVVNPDYDNIERIAYTLVDIFYANWSDADSDEDAYVDIYWDGGRIEILPTSAAITASHTKKSIKSNKRRPIKAATDDYKVKQLRTMLEDMDYDNNPNWSHATLHTNRSNYINLDAGAIQLLIDYYSGKVGNYQPIESAVKKNKNRRHIKASRTLEIFTFDELTPEQQAYVLENWSDMRKLAEVIYDWYNEDIMFGYQDEKQYIADKYANQYGLSINPDKLYWGSNSQGPYPEWNLEQVFDEYMFEDGLAVEFYGRGLDVHSEPVYVDDDLSPDDMAKIDEITNHAQEYIDEMWSYINDVCQAYPDDEWVAQCMKSNPEAFEFTISDSGEVKYY